MASIKLLTAYASFIASSILLFLQPVSIQILPFTNLLSFRVACKVGKVCPDWDNNNTHVRSEIFLGKTESRILSVTSPPTLSSLLALTVVMFREGKTIRRSVANCSATQREASTPPIKRSVQSSPLTLKLLKLKR